MHNTDSAHSQKNSFTILLSLSLNIHTHPSYKATKFCLIISTTRILLRRGRKEKKGKKEVKFYRTEWCFCSVFLIFFFVSYKVSFL